MRVVVRLHGRPDRGTGSAEDVHAQRPDCGGGPRDPHGTGRGRLQRPLDARRPDRRLRQERRHIHFCQCSADVRRRGGRGRRHVQRRDLPHGGRFGLYALCLLPVVGAGVGRRFGGRLYAGDFPGAGRCGRLVASGRFGFPRGGGRRERDGRFPGAGVPSRLRGGRSQSDGFGNDGREAALGGDALLLARRDGRFRGQSRRDVQPGRGVLVRSDRRFGQQRGGVCGRLGGDRLLQPRSYGDPGAGERAGEGLADGQSGRLFARRREGLRRGADRGRLYGHLHPSGTGHRRGADEGHHAGCGLGRGPAACRGPFGRRRAGQLLCRLGRRAGVFVRRHGRRERRHFAGPRCGCRALRGAHALRRAVGSVGPPAVAEQPPADRSCEPARGGREDLFHADVAPRVAGRQRRHRPLRRRVVRRGAVELAYLDHRCGQRRADGPCRDLYPSVGL